MGFMNTEVKKWFQSKAINGSLVSLISIAVMAANVAGWDIGTVEQWVALIGSVGGAITAIYGRIVAIQPVG